MPANASEMRVEQVPMQLIAAVRGRANAQNAGTVIRELLERLYSFARKTKIQTGRNVVLYSNLADKNLFATPEGVPIEVGVQVPAPFASAGIVICSATPEGVVATCVHFGPYEQLAGTHKAVQAWAKANGRQLAGPCWEVYGDWSDDPAQLRTHIYYLLQ